mgnify:CR=1 FL=1
MSLPYDLRESRDVLGTRSTLNRLLVRSLSNSISETLASGTASNYNTEQFGPNHRIIYDGVAEVFAKVILDITDLEDDSSISDLRAEFLTTKITSLVFEEEDTPVASDDYTLKQIILDTTKALVQGSEETVISELLTKSAGGSEVEITQVSNHLISVSTALLGYTSTGGSDSHRHLVLAPKTGVGSTLHPIGYRWGDELHQHEIINGVVQEANGHTHTVEFGLPPQIINLQNNLRKLLNTTKPAHIKVGEVSSIIGENISTPTTSTGVYSPDGLGGFTESFGSDLHFSLGYSLQENMRKARAGNYESLIYGYASAKYVRVYRSLVNKADRLLTRVESTNGNGDIVYNFQQYRRVQDLTEVRPETGSYNWSLPRLGETGTGTVNALGYFTADIGNANLPFVGEGELILLEGSAFFVEVRARNVFYLRALEMTLDNVGSTSGLVEVLFLDYTWVSSRKRNRLISHIVQNDPADVVTTAKIKAPIRKSFMGFPTTKNDIQSVEGHTITSYNPLTNEVLLGSLIANGTEINFLVPYGEGDVFSFTDLNSQTFVLNAPRRVRQETGALGARTILDSKVESYAGVQRGSFYGDKPSVGLFSTQIVTPLNSSYFSLQTGVKRTHGLGNKNLILGKPLDPSLREVGESSNPSLFYLNRSDQVQSIPSDRVSSFAVGRATVSNNQVPLYQFGFFPRDILSVKTVISDTKTEIDYTVEKGVLFTSGIENGTTIELEAISLTPLKSGQGWSSGNLILSEGQVPFDLFELGSAEPSVEEIMSNPQGRILRSGESDQDRKTNQNVSVQSEGQAGEQVFYDDDLTRLSLSGASYQNTNSVAQDRDRVYAPSLILNSSSSLVGGETQLVQSRNVIKDFVVFEFI